MPIASQYEAVDHHAHVTLVEEGDDPIMWSTLRVVEWLDMNQYDAAVLAAFLNKGVTGKTLHQIATGGMAFTGDYLERELKIYDMDTKVYKLFWSYVSFDFLLTNLCWCVQNCIARDALKLFPTAC
jgi:hypothetical protein